MRERRQSTTVGTQCIYATRSKSKEYDIERLYCDVMLMWFGESRPIHLAQLGAALGKPWLRAAGIV